VVAWWSRSAVTTILAGMGALWALRYFLS